MRINPPTREQQKTAIFLGAGASAADGAPMQSNLFKDYFALINSRQQNQHHEFELINFFQEMFDIDVMNSDLEKIIFPTFEEALGILDLADLKNEAFRRISNINLESNSGKIKFLRLYLLFLMADIINNKLKKTHTHHRKLIKGLQDNNLINDTVFLTTNYDILCDNALYNIVEYSNNKNIDYGVSFTNYENHNLQSKYNQNVKLLKLHGSLNWLHCPICNNLRITPNEKGLYIMMTDPNSMRCTNCEGIYSPVIVPPTFYKDMSKAYLGQVWNLAEKELLTTNHLIFCGYSFPDADIHIKYLIKRIQKNRADPKKLKITVINNHIKKSKGLKVEEENRFKRFLGNNINYTKLSFSDFANNPLKVYRS